MFYRLLNIGDRRILLYRKYKITQLISSLKEMLNHLFI